MCVGSLKALAVVCGFGLGCGLSIKLSLHPPGIGSFFSWEGADNVLCCRADMKNGSSGISELNLIDRNVY